ncbi:telomerase-binding protein EST1A-like [Diadema setosum]|uniref:telomerase-binding protein EST1A-like n=1 Tax=Diadema setosum TaxID=31175 RepID=UPI003B3A6282
METEKDKRGKMPSKGKREREQRKPDQVLYRPGQSRLSRNSSSAGSDLNTSREESPTKPAGRRLPADVGSTGDQSDSPTKEFSDRENKGEVRHGSNQEEKSRRQNISGGSRRDRADKRDSAANKQGKPAPKGNERHGSAHHREQRERPSRGRTSQTKSQVERKDSTNEEGPEESWEIRPEDWEAEVVPPTRETRSQGRGDTKSPQSSTGKKTHERDRDHRSKPSKGVKNVVNSPTPKEGAKNVVNSPTKLESLMGEDWDHEYEQHVQRRSPTKAHDHHGGKEKPRHDDDEMSGSTKKKDLVKSSRQNYASEMQKLRAKKERVEMEGAPGDDKQPDGKADVKKDLKITVKVGAEADCSSRVVQEKTSKRYSVGRSRQRMNSEGSTGSDNNTLEKIAIKSEDWDPSMDDVNYHLESMVITNQRFKPREFHESNAKPGYSEERRRISPKEERTHEGRKQPPRADDSKPSHLSNPTHDRREWRNERRDSDRRDVDRHARESYDSKSAMPDERMRDVNEPRQQRPGKSDGAWRDRDSSRSDSGSRREAPRRRDRERVSVSSDDSSERYSRRRGSSEGDDSGAKHGGGILRLPGKTEPDKKQQHHNYVPVYDQYYQPPQSQREPVPKPIPAQEEPKTKAKGRAGDKSLLWDPSKPDQKPALQHHHVKHEELHFHDPEVERANSDRGTPSPAVQPETWNTYYPYYPPGYGNFIPQNQPPPPPGMQPQYPYPPGPPYRYGSPSPPSWAEQAEAAHMYQSGHPASHPHAHMMQYQQPYGGPSYPLPPGVSPPPGFMNHPHAAMMQGHQSLNRQSAQKLLKDAAKCEKDLSNVLGMSIVTKDSLQQLLAKQQELEQLYEGIILLDLDMCNQYNVEQALWKNSYYQVIEGLRKAIPAAEAQGENLKEDLLEFMQHGNTFYEGLLNKLQSTYGFQLENRTGLDPLHEEPRRSIKLALLSAQRCMIALGDIARYKEQTNETSNYGKARSWYMKAQHLAPRNGRPYNQLAILALYTRRKLDAVYFYVRSLAATNPFITARESLMTLFEEVRRKVAHKESEEMAAKREAEERREQRRRRKRKPWQDENRGRMEVWISPDGQRMGGERLEEEEEKEMEMGEDLSKLSPAELNKKFVLSFLNVHGKLFTRTGMEAFEHAVEQLLREFRALLDHSPPVILSTRLVQLMAINMFGAANSDQSKTRPLIQEQAVQLGLDMFAILVRRCCLLLQGHLEGADSHQKMLSQDLHELLPGVKVYADWMMCHSNLWNPPPCCSSTTYSAAVNVWPTLAEFLNLVRRVKVPDVQFALNNEEDSQKVLLTEDLTLSGFVPLMSLPLQPVFIQADTSKILASDRVRLDSLTMFGEYLSGAETPLIVFRVKTDSYLSVAPEPAPPRQDQEKHREDVYKDDSDDVMGGDPYREEAITLGDSTISRLRERRDSLERQLRDREKRDATIQAIVENHRSQRALEVLIKPYYLVPDTNCFIDHLPIIQALVSCRTYLVVVPLVVINELDGLARGGREGQFSDPSHAARVQQEAQCAVEYLEDEFAARNRWLKALTSKGSVMETIRFRSEEADMRGSNDDHILQCCLHYCIDNARDYMPTDKDSPIRIQREVVLLTNDRNLRVKAIQQNVPVRDIGVFAKWAKV